MKNKSHTLNTTNSMDKSVNTSDTCDPKFKIILFILIVAILYLFINDTVDQLVKIILLVILYFMLFVDHCNDNEESCAFTETKEGFIDTNEDDNDNEDSNLIPFERESRINKLNNTRGKLGNFYVNCHSCGRKRILEERHKLQSDVLRSCQSYRTPCTGRGVTNCGNSGNETKGTCTGSCMGREHETMSFFNNQYVDLNQIFCYNCLLDNVHNDRYFLKNYVYWPSISDPVNGPPYV